MSKKALVILAILLIVVLLVAYWWFHPPINIHSTDTWLFVAVFVLLPLFVFWRAKSRTYETGNSKVDPSRTKAKAFKVASWVPVVIALVGVLGAVASLSIFPGNAAKYANVLQTQDADFAPGYPAGRLLRDSHHRPRFGRASGQSRHGQHSRVRQPVRDCGHV